MTQWMWRCVVIGVCLVVGLMTAPLGASTVTVTAIDGDTSKVEWSAKTAASPTGRWWVELEAAPTLAFEGGALRPVETTRSEGLLGLTRRYAATSPDVTGQRFDANSEAVRAYVRALDAERQQLLDQAAQRLGRGITPHLVLRHTANGFSVAMSEEEARRLASLDGVVSVTPVEVFAPQMDRSPRLVGASNMWNGSWNPWAPLNNLPRVRGEGMVIGIIDSGINDGHRVFSDQRSAGATHDYSNPYGQFLGECNQTAITCNNKLVGVYDFTTEGTLGRDPDDDGHGTHVASIAAGNPWTGITLSNTEGIFSMTGIAPNAHIISYKVCYDKHPTNSDLDGRCVGDAIRKAFEQAILNEVDVVNYSIGGDASDPWRLSSIPRLALNFWGANIPFVTSAGNSGPVAGSVGQPANAPWAIAVGNSTHDRRRVSTIDVGSRTDIAAQPGTGPELERDLSAPARRVDEVSAGNLRACDPLPSGSLQGEIAVMQRGDCLFIEKLEHAQTAGAVAVIMVNQEPGEAIIMGGLTDSTIPSVMISRDFGQVVLNDLQAGPLPATLRANERVIISSDLEDTLANSSSRGPNTTPTDIMKPDLVAPGSAIFSAHVPTETSLAFLSGTSMASPQVAGAIAILRQIHPSWGVDALMSAVVTTAQHDRIRVEGELANLDEQGGGRLRIDRAARAGLYLPLSRRQLEDANPARGGLPRSLNLPGLLNSNCGELCDFTRRVRAHRSGTWQVRVEGDLALSVSPSEFTLQAGQEQVLQIQASPAMIDGEVLQTGYVVLDPVQPSFANPNQIQMIAQRLSVGVVSGVTELPIGLQLTARDNRGAGVIGIDALEPVSELRLASSALVLPETTTLSLPQHQDVEDPFDGQAGTETLFFDVPEDAMALYVASLASTARDIDLFVGFSPSGEDRVDLAGLACVADSPDELETCAIAQPAAGRWWMVVQNWQASSADAEDDVVVARAVAMRSDDLSLTAAGPGRHGGGPIDIEVSFDQPLMQAGQVWFGAFELRDGSDQSLGAVPVLIERSRWTLPQTTALFPDEPYELVLEAGRTHDRLFIDVPPSATQLRVHVQGDAGVAARLRRMDFDALLATQPLTPAAPGDDLVSGEGSSAGFELVWPQDETVAPAPGRYYVVLDNQPVRDRQVTVTASVSEANAVQPRRVLWNPEGEVINQGLEYQTLGGVPFVVWYSFDTEGLPIFYLGADAARADSSVWVAPIDRYSSGGASNLNTPVGRVSMTAIDGDRVVFSWRVSGGHGSWLMSPAVPEACVEVDGALRSYSGHWHSPGLAQGGATMIMVPGAQFHVRYYYDAIGIGRWMVLAGEGAGPEDRDLDVLEFRGFCPTCDPVAPSSELVGGYFRDFSSESEGIERLEFISGPPLNQSFSTEVPIERLSDRLACP